MRTRTPSTAVTTSAAPTRPHREPGPAAVELVAGDEQDERHPRPREPPEGRDAGEQPPDQRILASPRHAPTVRERAAPGDAERLMGNAAQPPGGAARGDTRMGEARRSEEGRP